MSRGPGRAQTAGARLLGRGLGAACRLLTGTVGLWLRSGGMAPAVEGLGGGVGALGSGGVGLAGRAGLGQRLSARWRMRCRRARGRAAVLPSESLRRAPASSDRTPRSTSRELR